MLDIEPRLGLEATPPTQLAQDWNSRWLARNSRLASAPRWKRKKDRDTDRQTDMHREPEPLEKLEFGAQRNTSEASSRFRKLEPPLRNTARRMSFATPCYTVAKKLNAARRKICHGKSQRLGSCELQNTWNLAYSGKFREGIRASLLFFCFHVRVPAELQQRSLYQGGTKASKLT